VFDYYLADAFDVQLYDRVQISSNNQSDDGVIVPCLIHQDGQCKQFPLREMKKPVRQRSN
jgi:hypothetical protein